MKHRINVGYVSEIMEQSLLPVTSSCADQISINSVYTTKANIRQGVDSVTNDNDVLDDGADAHSSSAFDGSSGRRRQRRL